MEVHGVCHVTRAMLLQLCWSRQYKADSHTQPPPFPDMEATGELRHDAGGILGHAEGKLCAYGPQDDTCTENVTSCDELVSTGQEEGD